MNFVIFHFLPAGTRHISVSPRVCGARSMRLRPSILPSAAISASYRADEMGVIIATVGEPACADRQTRWRPNVLPRIEAARGRQSLGSARTSRRKSTSADCSSGGVQTDRQIAPPARAKPIAMWPAFRRETAVAPFGNLAEVHFQPLGAFVAVQPEQRANQPPGLDRQLLELSLHVGKVALVCGRVPKQSSQATNRPQSEQSVETSSQDGSQ